MESARELTTPQVGAALPFSVERHDAAAARRPEVVVLQVDSTVAGIDGFSWLRNRRDAETRRALDEVQREASARGWSWAELTRARLKLLRPRRAEINGLGAAYLAALTPGAADAVAALRRAGVTVVLASELAAEALFGVATALGVGPEELRAPRLRFDAIGAYVGCDLPEAPDDEMGDANDVADAPRSRANAAVPRTLHVGTHRSAMFAPRGGDRFVAFVGVVALEDRTDAAARVDSFRDLATMVLR